MPTTYSESFGADLSENELFQCVSILLTEMSTGSSEGEAEGIGPLGFPRLTLPGCVMD